MFAKLFQSRSLRTLAIAIPFALTLAAGAAHADEATIRRNLPAKLTDMPAIKSVRPAPIPGLFEVVLEGNIILYADRKGEHIVEGSIVRTATKTNLTSERMNTLNAIKFSQLALNDSFTIVKGAGERKLALFTDPNCGFCKRYEGELAKLENVTLHVFLYPVLGPDSIAKSGNIWCAKDKAHTYSDWMTNGTVPPAISCDTKAVDRNVAFGRNYGVSGTPTTFFADGSRLSGAHPIEEINKRLQGLH